jgi:hypothetical protein
MKISEGKPNNIEIQESAEYRVKKEFFDNYNVWGRSLEQKYKFRLKRIVTFRDGAGEFQVTKKKFLGSKVYKFSVTQNYNGGGYTATLRVLDERYFENAEEILKEILDMIPSITRGLVIKDWVKDE